jgi:hypothetical protein
MQLGNTNLPENPFGGLELRTSCVQSNRGNDFNGDSERMREKLKVKRATNDYTRRHVADSLNHEIHSAIRTGKAAYTYGTHIFLVLPRKDMYEIKLALFYYLEICTFDLHAFEISVVFGNVRNN